MPKSIFVFVLIAAFGVTAYPQNSPAFPTPTPQTVKLSQLLASNLNRHDRNTDISSENKAKAYSKLLEGQRHVWAITNSRRGRTATAVQNSARLSRLAFQQAIELNPVLSEAYTALAELSISAPPSDIDEAISLAELAVRIEKDNFGARRILARLYTFKSGINTGAQDPVMTERAINAWNYIAGLDPRNAEAWAFLSEFYDRQGKSKERIEALQKWLSSATPIDSQFYQRITGGRENLSPESATLKLGEALLKAGRTQEAISSLSIVVADEPDNSLAVELLREAIQSSTGQGTAAAVQALQQAVYANPNNPVLVNLLSDVHAKIGNLDEASRVLRDAAIKAAATDRVISTALYVSLGDFYERSKRYSESIAAYEKAIEVRGFNKASTLGDDERSFLTQVFERMIRSAKNADRPGDVSNLIERARTVLGKDDAFPDRQLVSFYRESGKRPEALTVVRSLRGKLPLDEGLARLEATLLGEMGRVDEAVEGFRKHVAAKATGTPATTSRTNSESSSFSIEVPKQDQFSDLLFISQLYSYANRGKEAIEAANQAYSAARGDERRQMAKLTLATAQQMSGDHAGAEATLRDILKASPGNPIALNNLGYFLLERDERFEEARTLIQQAVDVDPTNPSYLDSLGWAYFKLGKLVEAEKYLKDAVRFDSMSATIQEHLGDVYNKQGKTEIARGHWQKAVDLASDKADLDRLRAKLK
jgi:tetratricopeptide (TPR) repeat protein